MTKLLFLKKKTVTQRGWPLPILKEGKSKREYHGDFSFILNRTLAVFFGLVSIEDGHALEKLLKQGMFAFCFH